MKVGDRVVYVMTVPWKNEGIHKSVGVLYPKEKQNLTVRSVNNNSYLTFEEIVNAKKHYSNGFLEIMFNPINFRKIKPNFTNALTRKLATDFIEEDSKVIETERERVLTVNAEF